MRSRNQPSGAEAGASPEGAAALENEQQLWDLMRPEVPDLRDRRRDRLSELLRQLVMDYPQLLVVPLMAAATWTVLSMQ